jgi:hypothetical protein
MSGQIQFPPPVTPPEYRKPPSSKPTAAGILLLLAAIQGIGIGVIMAVFGEAMESWMMLNVDLSDLPANIDIGQIFMICGAMMLIFGIFALVGAVMALQRKSWSLAVIGAVMGLFTVGIFLTGSIFSLIALILLAVSRDEFN